LNPDQIRDQYDGDYYIFREPPARRWSRTTQLYLDHLYPHEGQTRGRRLLDVGCACGELLALARQRGWDVHGVELSPQAAASAQKQHQLPVSIGPLEEQNGQLGTFDVIVATDVIEHVPSPRQFVRSVYDRLKPGGLAILETPNWGSPWRRFGGRRWLGYNRFHIFLFEGRSLSSLMRTTGFEQLVMYTTTHTGYAHWGHRPELSKYTNKFPPALRWRAEQWLNRLTPASLATRLQDCPPTSCEDAARWVEQQQTSLPKSVRPNRGAGDNLAVVAKKPKAEPCGAALGWT
jgi:2-polyprenyl-3-methyl-5-hydroxy-6-metoxy-1,4-benzoquinol methylase